jgi:hypothetical protein
MKIIKRLIDDFDEMSLVMPPHFQFAAKIASIESRMCRVKDIFTHNAFVV